MESKPGEITLAKFFLIETAIRLKNDMERCFSFARISINKIGIPIALFHVQYQNTLYNKDQRRQMESFANGWTNGIKAYYDLGTFALEFEIENQQALPEEKEVEEVESQEEFENNLLNGIVPKHLGCMVCGERRMDALIWQDDEYLKCDSCGHIFHQDDWVRGGQK